MEIKLIDRWDDIEGNKYLTLDIGNNDRVDVKQWFSKYGWHNYIMDCENGKEVYEAGETNGYRPVTFNERKEIIDFVEEQFKVEAELDEEFKRGEEA